MNAYGMSFVEEPSGPKSRQLESYLTLMVADAKAAWAMKQSSKTGKNMRDAKFAMAMFFRMKKMMKLKKLDPTEWNALVKAASLEGPMTLDCFQLQQEYERLQILLGKASLQKSLDFWTSVDAYSRPKASPIKEQPTPITRMARPKASPIKEQPTPITHMTRPTTPSRQTVPTEADFPPLTSTPINDTPRPAAKPVVKETPQARPTSINGIPIRYETSLRRKGRKGRRKKKK